MKNYLIASAFALASGFVGMVLPFTTEIGGIRNPTNIPLGFVYGFGWYVAGFVKSIRSPNVQTFGGKVWPSVVMAAIAYFLGRALSHHPDKRLAITICCIIPLLLIVPGDLVASTPLKNIPTYSGTLSAVY
jgi:ABC-type Mn2+/Zn2+ transport system permease subunit